MRLAVLVCVEHGRRPLRGARRARELDGHRVQLALRDVRVLGMPTRTRTTAAVRERRLFLEWAARGDSSDESVAKEAGARPGTFVSMIIDRIVHFRARTILGVVGILLAVGVVLVRPVGRSACPELALDRAVPRAGAEPLCRVAAAARCEEPRVRVGNRLPLGPCACSSGWARSSSRRSSTR